MVRIGADPNWSHGSGALPELSPQIYKALIDTGAEGTIIDELVAADVGATASHTVTVSSFQGPPHGSGGATIQLLLPGANVVFSGGAALLPLRSEGAMFDLILGRSFLAHCRFVVDGKGQPFRLWWLG